jgi:VpsR domain
MSGKTLRQLVYVSRSHDQVLQRLLMAHDWAVLTCDSVRQAERLLSKSSSPSIGIFDISSSFEHDATSHAR